MKFSEEATLPASFTPEEQRRLEQVYDPSEASSIWSVACRTLGLPRAQGPLVSWYSNVPYVNWGQIVETVSCGFLTVVPKGGSWAYAERRKFSAMMGLVKSQWKIERYVDKRLRPGTPLPADSAEKLVESTALGLCLQAIMQRLPSSTPQEFAAWLAAPDKAPLTLRKTLMQIDGIQRRRTLLSPAWIELFPPRPARDYGPDTPNFFWDYPPAVPVAPAAPSPPATPAVAAAPQVDEWHGLAVCQGQVTGRAFLVPSMKDFTPPDMSDLPILIFPRARPETVEFFPHAAALVFAEGGALSHACTVAREQGIPCVTGLGPEFFRQLQDMAANGQKLWLAIDGAGTVRLVKS